MRNREVFNRTSWRTKAIFDASPSETHATSREQQFGKHGFPEIEKTARFVENLNDDVGTNAGRGFASISISEAER